MVKRESQERGKPRGNLAPWLGEEFCLFVMSLKLKIRQFFFRMRRSYLCNYVSVDVLPSCRHGHRETLLFWCCSRVDFQAVGYRFDKSFFISVED